MLYSKQRTLEDRIIELAAIGPATIKKLHEQIIEERAGISLRAIYKAVDQLISSGVLLKVGKVVRLDHEWVRVLQSKLQPAPVSQLAEGERVSYAFNSIAHLDAFWKTIVLQLEEYEKDGKIFFYNPHNFWAYLPDRRESESAYYAHFAESKLHAFFTVGGKTVADKEFKKKYQNDYLQIHTNAVTLLGRADHITVLGNHILTVRIGKNIAQQIDAIYETENSITALVPDLQTSLKGLISVRFTLEHNPLKAEKIRKMLSRDFYFPTQAVESA